MNLFCAVPWSGSCYIKSGVLAARKVSQKTQISNIIDTKDTKRRIRPFNYAWLYGPKLSHARKWYILLRINWDLIVRNDTCFSRECAVFVKPKAPFQLLSRPLTRTATVQRGFIHRTVCCFVFGCVSVRAIVKKSRACFSTLDSDQSSRTGVERWDRGM